MPGVPAVRSRRAAAAVPRHGGAAACPALVRAGGLPVHPAADRLAVRRVPAPGQMRPQRPHPPHRLAHRRYGPGVHPRPDRPAQGHPPGQLLLAGAPRVPTEAAVRAGPARCGGSGWPPARPGSTATSTPSATTATDAAAGKALRAPALPAHPRSAHLLRPGPRRTEMVYANADLTKAEQAAEIIAFADYWNNATGADPGLLVFDSQLTTYKILDAAHRPRHPLAHPAPARQDRAARLAALPASAWKTVTIARPGRYRRPRLHEDMIKIKDISAKVRQIAVTQHRPRRAHPAHHQRSDHPRQGPVRPLRRADDRSKTNSTPTSAGSTSTPSPAASRSTSTSTPPSPSSPATSTACSPAT